MARAGSGGGAPPTWLPAIVVGMQDYAEADRIVRLLSPDHGRVSALARRARASKRRFGGALDIGNRVDAALRPGRGSLWHVDEVRLVDGRLGAREDLSRLSLLAYACELVSSLARQDHAEPRLFGLLDMACVLLDNMEEPPGDLFRLALEAKALTFAGFTPVLDRCATCGKPVAPPMVLIPAGDGAAHAACQGGIPVDPAFLAALDRARRTPLRDLLDEVAPAGPRWFLADLVEAHAGRALRSRTVLAQLFETMGPGSG